MSNIKIIAFYLITAILIFGKGIFGATSVSAQELVVYSSPQPKARIEKLNDVPVKNDFSIGPTKINLDLESGQEVVSEVQITNRIGEDVRFKIEVEDFVSSENTDKYTQFLGIEKSQFSSKEWFSFDIKEFTLKHGERMYLPIKISVPKDAEAGDHYSAVFIKTLPKDNVQNGGIQFSSRAGSLYLIKVRGGSTINSGNLVDFSVKNKFNSSLPVTFKLSFLNSGDFHLEPTGNLIITNMFNSQVEKIKIEDWVVLRSSTRNREVIWQPKFAFGVYRATVEMYRGYDDIIDTNSLVFYVLPIQTVSIIFAVLVIFAALIFFFTSKYEIRLKK